jgi:hypothetical protein
MGAVLEAARFLVDKPDERLVDERGRLERLPRTLPANVARGKTAQLVVDERHQLGDGLLVAPRDLLEAARGVD